jgi:hypothetical protein
MRQFSDDFKKLSCYFLEYGNKLTLSSHKCRLKNIPSLRFMVIDGVMEKKGGRGWLGEGRREGSTRRRGCWKTRPLLRICERI